MLPLLGLGLMGGGLYGLQKVANEMKAGMEKDQRDEFRTRGQGLQQGLDLNTEAGAQQYIARMMNEKDMFSTASGMLNASMGRAQEQRQYENSFNNLSAAQKENVRQGDAQLAETARYHQGSLGMQAQELALRRDDLKQQMGLRVAQFENRNAWTPQQVQDEQNKATGVLLDNMKAYRDTLPQYASTSELLKNAEQNPIAAHAAIINLVKVLDPTSVVSRGEAGDAIQGGLFGNIANDINAAKGKGFTPETRARVQETIDSVMKARSKAAGDMVQGYQQQFAANPYTNRPALNFDQAIAGINFDPVGQRLAALAQEQKRLGGGGGGGAVGAVNQFLNPGAAGGGVGQSQDPRDAAWDARDLHLFR